MLWTWARLLEKTEIEWKIGFDMREEYYRLYKKLMDVCHRDENAEMADLDRMAIDEIRHKMNAHIKSCPECQENMAWMRGETE